MNKLILLKDELLSSLPIAVRSGHQRRILGVLLGTLLSAPAAVYATTITDTFNPISATSPFSNTLTYSITLTPAEVATAFSHLPAGTTGVQSITVQLPPGSGLTGSGTGTGITYTVIPGTPGPPATPDTLVLTCTAGAGCSGISESVTITTGANPTGIVGPHPTVIPTSLTKVVGTPFIADLGPLIIPGVSVPIIAVLPPIGGTDIDGDATAGTYVFVWQDDNPGADGNILLGEALVGGGGLFDVALSRPLLPNELVSIGVAANLADVPGGGQVALQFELVPEVPTLALLGTGLLGFVEVIRRKRGW